MKPLTILLLVHLYYLQIQPGAAVQPSPQIAPTPSPKPGPSGTQNLPSRKCSVSPELNKKLRAILPNIETLRILIDLPSRLHHVLSFPDVSAATGNQKALLMAKYLKELTKIDQHPFAKQLKSLNIIGESFYITNKLSVESITLPQIKKILKVTLPSNVTKCVLRVPLVVHLIGNPSQVPEDRPFLDIFSKRPEIQWGVDQIGATQVWQRGFTGKGIVVANIDSGVNHNHEALRENYAGVFRDGTIIPTSDEELRRMEEGRPRQDDPIDEEGHGTHVMGTICGTSRGIGVAPAARWIACRAFSGRHGDSNSLDRCAEWILEQTPAVVANSWGLNTAVSPNSFFNHHIQAWKNASIFPVFSIGNYGGNCRTGGSPGDQEEAFSVGNTDPGDSVYVDSSRGPGYGVRNERAVVVQKPDVSAPGTGILSASLVNDVYITLTGTSMACPHVAGAVALMKSARRGYTNEEIEARLREYAFRPPRVASLDNDGRCMRPSVTLMEEGGPVSPTYPNAGHGYGRIRVHDAMGL